MSRSNDSNKKGFLESFRTRSFRVGGYSVTASAIVLAIAVLLNVIVNALPMSLTQIDTSYNQLFSISDQTTKLIGALEQDGFVCDGDAYDDYQTLGEFPMDV